MKPKNRVIAIIAVCIAVGIVVDAVVIVFVEPLLVPPLLIPAGTSIPQGGYQVSFRVEGDTGRLVGSWYASQGGLIWISAADSPSSGLYNLPCISGLPWHGSYNVTLARGVYTMSFSEMGANLTVTKTMTVLYPGNSSATSPWWTASWCGLFM